MRVHNTPEAHLLARTAGARSLTIGERIAFAPGQFTPGDEAANRLLAHELTHVVQHRLTPSAPHAGTFTSPGDASEREASSIEQAFGSGEPAPPILQSLTAAVARQVDDPDHPPSPPPPSASPDVTLAPLEDWTPFIDIFDPGTFWTPGGTTREQIAQRLYGDPNHFGGFDIIGENHVRLRNFDGVAADVVAAMRTALDARLQTDVGTVVEILMQRWANEAEDWRMLRITTFWSGAGDLTNTANRSYFDAYLDLLDTHRLRAWGLFSDTVKPASEWLADEFENKLWPRYLLARRSSRGADARPDGGETAGALGRVTGPVTDAPRTEYGGEKVVGGYSYFVGEDHLLVSEKHKDGMITVDRMIVDETTATRAEIALRNSGEGRGRVMIPGGNGRFYGYTIDYPHFWDADYVPPTNQQSPRLENFWWHYPGTVFIPGGSFQPEFGRGGEAERTQRMEILNHAIQDGLGSLRSLDLDVLSLMTLDQRVSVIALAAVALESANAALIARILYATPALEFIALEHRLSTDGTMERLMKKNAPGGELAVVGRIFTVKALEAGPVPGENLEGLPEFTVGFDKDGYYHWAEAHASSTVVTTPQASPGAAPATGHEATGAGGTPGAISRAVSNLQPYIFRLGGYAATFYRGFIAHSLIVPDGPPLGPFLPTQLVRIRTAEKTPQTRIVTVLEAIGLLQLPDSDILGKMIATQVQGTMVLLGGLGIVRAFGPALAGALAEGGGVRAAAASVAEVAATQTGRAALVNAGLISAMSAIDSYREEIAGTAAGRAFLEIYDVAMGVWIAHDAARLITSGLIPKLIAAADRVALLPGVLRDAVMPLRAEAEAMRRAIARYASPAEAAAAATIDNAAMAAPAESRPGFMAMLRVARGEVAAERFMGQVAGTPLEAAGKRVFSRLQGVVTSSEAEAAKIVGDTPEAERLRKTATARAERAARAQFAVATRASQLRPDARKAFLEAVDATIAARPNSIASLTDLLTAAAESRTPNVFIREVQRLVGRTGVSAESLSVLGAKARRGRDVLDLAWLNRTSITDETLDFLGRDPNTKWDTFRRAAMDPAAGDVMKSFRIFARGAGAEMVAAGQAEQLGSNVQRQVRMGSSEIDYQITVAGKPRGFEVKGFTADTWEEALDAAIQREEALDAAIQRLNKKGLSAEQLEAVDKIDKMIGQLQDAQAATGRKPYLGFTDALPQAQQQRLRHILNANRLGGTQFVPLPEGQIREAAQGSIGEALGIPRPGSK